MSVRDLDFGKMIENLKTLLKMEEQIDEGTEGDLDRLGSGVLKNYLTYPHTPEVTSIEEGAGIIRYSYDCRVRREIYTGGIMTDTEDFQRPGVITADFEFTVRGKVLLTNINSEGDRPGKAANSIVKRISDTNGKDVSSYYKQASNIM